MNYSIKQLIEEHETNKYLFFWGHRPSIDGTVTASCFSQWWESQFSDNGMTYFTAEHWMMSKKAELFDDSEVMREILVAKSPAEAKKIGRKVKNFDQNKWDEEKFAIVKNGNLLKFKQNPALMDFLLNTGNRIIVEASPVDPIWGIGLSVNDSEVQHPMNWKGENLLGFALMEVRDSLRNENK